MRGFRNAKRLKVPTKSSSHHIGCSITSGGRLFAIEGGLL
jgi:hypothetical protein